MTGDSNEDFSKIKLWAREIVNSRIISSSDTNIGITTITNHVNLYVKLNRFMSKEDILREIENALYR